MAQGFPCATGSRFNMFQWKEKIHLEIIPAAIGWAVIVILLILILLK